MPLKIIDGDTFAELTFTCPADRDLGEISRLTQHEKIIEKITSCSDAVRVQKKNLQEDTWKWIKSSMYVCEWRCY